MHTYHLLLGHQGPEAQLAVENETLNQFGVYSVRLFGLNVCVFVDFVGIFGYFVSRALGDLLSTNGIVRGGFSRFGSKTRH